MRKVASHKYELLFSDICSSMCPQESWIVLANKPQNKLTAPLSPELSGHPKNFKLCRQLMFSRFYL